MSPEDEECLKKATTFSEYMSLIPDGIYYFVTGELPPGKTVEECGVRIVKKNGKWIKDEVDNG